MKQGYISFAWLVCFSLMLAACAGGISKEARSRVTYNGPFTAVLQAPEKYRNETVMWGGKIISSQTTDNGTELTVLQLVLGSQNRPADTDQSKGRFLIRSSQFLDPAIYSAQSLITAVGQLSDAETRTIGEMEYRYPVLDLIEIKKWPPPVDTTPRFYFGIGVGKTF